MVGPPQITLASTITINGYDLLPPVAAPRISAVPLPILVGLSVFLLSASAAIVREYQKERAAGISYSAARF